MHPDHRIRSTHRCLTRCRHAGFTLGEIVLMGTAFLVTDLGAMFAPRLGLNRVLGALVGLACVALLWCVIVGGSILLESFRQRRR